MTDYVRSAMLALATLALLAGCAVAPVASKTAGLERVSNIIIGGGMVHCSSMLLMPSPQCSSTWPQILHDDPAFAGLREADVLFGPIPGRTFTYLVTPASLHALAALPERLVSTGERARLASVLAPQAGAGPLTAARFGALLAGASAQVVAAASEVFVERPAHGANAAPRARQLRSIAYTANTDTAAIYRAVVAAAAQNSGKARPTIGVVTASVDNPYNDHDIYVTAFQSAGADVVWLPLDGGLRRALDAGDCAHLAIDYSVYASVGTGRQYLHMDQVFPDLDAARRQACANQGEALNRDLERIDGIVFTGGDQMRHLDSLAGPHGASAQLKIIQRRHAAGELVVAGSSAGDAVQAGGSWRGKPVPMIAGGESPLALASGFAMASGPVEEDSERRASYHPGGGLGVFSFGPLDSHFSQRGREGRLTRLVAASGMDYGFGVDENTALVVARADAAGRTTMGVTGAGGVWVVDLRQAQASGGADAPFAVRGARIHHLHAGDRLTIDRQGQLEVMLAEVEGQPAAPPPAGARFRLGSLAERMLRDGSARAQAVADGFSFTLQRPAAARLVRTGRGQASYAGLVMDIVPCEGRCESH